LTIVGTPSRTLDETRERVWEPDLEESCWLTACTLTDEPLEGAVRFPAASMVPAEVDQATALEKLPDPFTVAAQLVVAPYARLATLHCTETLVMLDELSDIVCAPDLVASC
jgi:hypothetical protein